MAVVVVEHDLKSGDRMPIFRCRPKIGGAVTRTTRVGYREPPGLYVSVDKDPTRFQAQWGFESLPWCCR
jgi:hypothetical protein